MPIFNDNIARMLQMRNIFGVQNQPVGNDLPSQGGIMGNLPQENVFQPRTQDQDRFRQTIDQMPQREEPGLFRKIMAGFVGAGQGQEAARRFRYGKYYRDMEDWEAKADPLGELAKMENQTNTQNRISAYNQDTINTQNRRIDVQEQANQERTDIAKKKLELDRIKMTNPDFDLKEGVRPDGKSGWFLIDTKNPATAPIDTGLTKDQLTDLEVIQKKGEWQVKAAQNQAGLTRETQRLDDERDWGNPETVFNSSGKPLGEYQTNRVTGAVRKVNLPGTTRIAPTGSSGADNEKSDSQKKVEVGSRTRALLDRHTNLRRFVTLDGDNVTIAEAADTPVFSRNKFSSADREAVRAHIYEGKPLPAGFMQGTNVNTPVKAPVRNPMEIAPPGKLKVISPDGKEGSIPIEQWPAAEKKGFKKVIR